MTAGVYTCARCGNTNVSYDYGLRIPACTKCKNALRDFKKDMNS